MSIRHAIWKVGEKPERLGTSTLANEKTLENMIVQAPEILSSDWMLIGQQVSTGLGGRLDLLAIAPDGALVLIELKRDRTPREVIAQALDYASWVDGLRSDEIAAIYERFAPGRRLDEAYFARFGQRLAEDQLNLSHQIVVVAASLDDSSERIVAYLSERGVPINVLCFEVFAFGGEKLLSRAWLLDPATSQADAEPTALMSAEPWNGEFYVSFGDANDERSWEEAVRYGFVCAGGGAWYSRTLKLLSPGDRIWVRIPQVGYVGVGRVRTPAEPATAFMIGAPGPEKSALDVLTAANYHRKFADDPERQEWFVGVDWLSTVTKAAAIDEVGLFGNQNTVARPRDPKWRHTVERLKSRLPGWNG